MVFIYFVILLIFGQVSGLVFWELLDCDLVPNIDLGEILLYCLSILCSLLFSPLGVDSAHFHPLHLSSATCILVFKYLYSAALYCQSCSSRSLGFDILQYPQAQRFLLQLRQARISALVGLLASFAFGSSAGLLAV